MHTALKDADEAKLADKIQKEHSLHVPQDDKVTVAVKKGKNNNCVCDHASFPMRPHPLIAGIMYL